MFDFLNNMAGRVGDLFKVEGSYTPETPMSSPDAIKTGAALSNLGYLGQNGESEFSLLNSVKAFQDAQGLKVDGVIHKGGPTEQAISSALAEQKAEPLASNVKVTQTADKSYQASASFQDKPDTNIPQKSKAEMDKLWEQVNARQKPKTTQQALQGLLDNKLYQKKDPAYLQHVGQEFKRAYKGDVQYDETGKMIQPVPEIGPDEVRPYVLKSEEPSSEEHLPERVWDPEQEQRDRQAYARKNPKKKVEAKQYSYEEMQELLEHDIDAFNKLPQEDRSNYHAYQMTKHVNRRPDRTASDNAQVERNAILAGREAGAGSYVGEAITQPFLEFDAKAGLGLDLLMGEKPDYKAFDQKMKSIKDRIPAGYQSARGIGQAQEIGSGAIKLGTTFPLLAPIGTLESGGETARKLAKAGVPIGGQRIGAAITGISNQFGGRFTKFGLKKVNDEIRKRFGKDLAKMSPEQLKQIGDAVLGEAWSLGPKGIVEHVIPSLGKRPTDAH